MISSALRSPPMSHLPRVCWLFSPIRSGSSITVYAAAAGLGWPVADEIFGPWDRTRTPYHYPRSQVQLLKAFKNADECLTRDIAALATSIFDELIETHRAEGVICKHPHASIGPAEVARFWPKDRCVVLLRNPLFALNSLFVRGWEAATGGGNMLDYFSTIGRRWLADPNRLLYDDMQHNPADYFTRVYEVWGLEPTAERLERAVRYKATHYHHSSKSTEGTEPGDRPSKVRSQQRWALPERIVEAYLADPLMREIFAAAGWPREREAYPTNQPGRTSPPSDLPSDARVVSQSLSAG